MKREQLKEFFKSWYSGEFTEDDTSQSKLLTEQDEDDLFGDDEAEEGGDEAADDTAGEAGDEAADEEAAEGEEETDVEEEEEVVAIEAGDEVRLGKQFDIALDSILQDYEMNALKSAQIHVAAQEDISSEISDSTNEWHKAGLGNLLFEQEAPEEEEVVVSETELDIDLFSQDVARLIQNYQVLMDMESIIFNKAKEFLIIKYGDGVAEAFAEILRLKHGLDFDSEIDALEDIEVAAPLAVGAGGADGGA